MTGVHSEQRIDVAKDVYEDNFMWSRGLFVVFGINTLKQTIRGYIYHVSKTTAIISRLGWNYSGSATGAVQHFKCKVRLPDQVVGDNCAKSDTIRSREATVLSDTSVIGNALHPRATNVRGLVNGGSSMSILVQEHASGETVLVHRVGAESGVGRLHFRKYHEVSQQVTSRWFSEFINQRHQVIVTEAETRRISRSNQVYLSHDIEAKDPRTAILRVVQDVQLQVQPSPLVAQEDTQYVASCSAFWEATVLIRLGSSGCDEFLFILSQRKW